MQEEGWTTEASAHVVTDYRGTHWQATIVVHGCCEDEACAGEGEVVRDVLFNVACGSQEEAELRLRGQGVTDYVVRDETGQVVEPSA